MEDAHIAVAPFSNKKYGLFAVFDGHGGTIKLIQGPKWLSLSKDILRKNCKIMIVLKTVIIRKP